MHLHKQGWKNQYSPARDAHCPEQNDLKHILSFPTVLNFDLKLYTDRKKVKMNFTLEIYTLLS